MCYYHENNICYRSSIVVNLNFIYISDTIEQTLGDFWRMVWQQNSGKIVMLTNLDEVKTVC